MNKQQIMQIASESPQFAQAVQELNQQMQANPISPQQLNELIKMMEFALNHPEAYPQIVEAAIKDGYTQPGDMPTEFNPTVLVSILAALYIIQTQMAAKQQGHLKAPPQMARGGLMQAARHLQAQGRNGDTMLAHINPQEARMLRQAGGAGTINPQTGLPEFFNLGSFLSAIIPIAINYFVPGAGVAIGEAMGLAGTAAAIAGGAVIGAGSSALTGGNIAQGALMGGMGGGLGDWAGSATNAGLELGLSDAGAKTLGAGMMGAVGGAATGQGMLQGALQGAGGQYLGSQVQGLGGTGAVGVGVNEAGKTFGNAMAAGYDPKTAVTMGGLAGLAQGLASRGAATAKPSDAVFDSLKNANVSAGPKVESMSADEYANTVAQGLPASSGTPPSSGSGLTLNKALMGAGLLSALSEAPQDVQQAVSTMSPAQQKYFSQPLVQWDWAKLKQDAAASGTSLSEYVARNWNDVYSGAYNKAPAATAAPATVPLARGGPLSQVAYLARGSGSGRADTIDARLSDGEYVMDAETVALLGDGSNQEGAKRLDEMRRNLRAQKGKVLAKGKFSPNAKSPLAYLKGVA
jgi:hypothetical protein